MFLTSLGEKPPLDIETAASPSEMRDGKRNVHSDAASATLTGMPRFLALTPISLLTFLSSVAATAI